jgi:DNA polymerase-3 subunit delta
MQILERQMAEGTYLPILLSGLARHVRQLWQAKDLMSKGIRGKALAQPMNIKSPYIAEKLGNSAKNFDVTVLRNVFLLLCDADYKMKTGQGGEELLEEAVIALCSNRKY